MIFKIIFISYAWSKTNTKQYKMKREIHSPLTQLQSPKITAT